MRLCSVENWNDGTGPRFWLRLQDSGSSDLYRIDTGIGVALSRSVVNLAFSPNGQYLALTFDFPIEDRYHVQAYYLTNTLGQSGTIDAGQLIYKSSATQIVNYIAVPESEDPGWYTSKGEASVDDSGNVFCIELAYSDPGAVNHKINFVQITSSTRTLIKTANEPGLGVGVTWAPWPRAVLDTAKAIFGETSGGSPINVGAATTAGIEDFTFSFLAGPETGMSSPSPLSFRAGRSENDAVWYDQAYTGGPGPPQTFFDYDVATSTVKECTFASPPASHYTQPILCLSSGAGFMLNDIWQVYAVTQTGTALATGSLVANISPTPPDSTPTDQFRAISLTDVAGQYAFAGLAPATTGNITVSKVTQPGGSSQVFSFTPTWEAPFTLTDGEFNPSGPLAPGTYSITETPVEGWTTSWNQDPSALVLNAGENINLICTNTFTGSQGITVRKVTVPGGLPQEFTFTPSYGSPFTLKDGESNTSGILAPGVYSVIETPVSGWFTSTDLNPAAIRVVEGQFTVITFTNSVATSGAVMSDIEFPMPNGKFLTVYLDASGATWYDDAASPCSDNTIDESITAGSQFKAEVYDEKLWFAYYNPVLSEDFTASPFVGTEIPRYYDGQQFWRVTSDAPGIGPSFANLTIPTYDAESLVRSANVVTAQLIGTSPGSPTSIRPSWWVTLEDTSAKIGSVPVGTDPNTDNELFQAMGGTATFQGDGQGNITVQTTSAVTNLPVGAWFYYWVAPPPQLALLSFTLPDVDHVRVMVSSATTLSIGEQVQIVGATVNDKSNTPTFVGNPILTITALTPTTFDAVYVNNGGGGQTLSNGVAIPVGNYGVGYAQVTSVTGTKTFQFFIPGNATTIQLSGLVYDLWAIQPSVAPTGQSIRQSFQVLAVDTSTTPNTIQWHQAGPDNSYTGTDTIAIVPQAAIAAGQRNAVLMFKSQNGAITAPSVPVTVATNAGSSYLEAIDLPIGPLGTVQRIVAFTASGGSDYFYITPAEIPAVASIPALTSPGTIIPDNSSTSFVFDFTDDALLSGTAIDVLGNNLFEQDVLSPCLGVIEYQGRLAWWGEINNIKNFVNMGFDGGYNGTLGDFFTLPLGWDASEGDEAGVLIAQVPGYLGFAYQMQTGYNNLIQQSAYQDYYGGQILESTRSYLIRFLAKASAPGMAGNLIVDIYSAPEGSTSMGTVLATAILPLAGLGLGNKWYTVPFDAAMPASIPSDAVLRVYLQSTVDGGRVTLDELEIIDANYPVLYDQVILSYYQNPFGYDLITGVLSVDPSQPVTASFRQRGALYLITDQSLHQAQNNGTTEPNGWNVVQYASQCGSSGPNAVDFGEELAWWGGRFGGRIFDGNPATKKITQEISPIWEDINWQYQTFLWVRNDPIERMLMFGIPVAGAAMPSKVLTMSYRLSDNAYNIPDPIHISQYSGKLIVTDLGRRWSPWNLTLNCAALCTRPAASGGLARIMVFGAGTGEIPAAQPGGTLYMLDTENYPPLNPSATSWNCHDDDYGRIDSYYQTYYWFPKDIDQNPILSLYRKLYNYLSVHITGVGTLEVTPYVDSQSTPGRTLVPYTLSLDDPGYDIEYHPNVRGDRVSWKFRPLPIAPSIDAAMALTHLQVSGRKDKVFPLRGTIFSGG